MRLSSRGQHRNPPGENEQASVISPHSSADSSTSVGSLSFTPYEDSLSLRLRWVPITAYESPAHSSTADAADLYGVLFVPFASPLLRTQVAVFPDPFRASEALLKKFMAVSVISFEEARCSKSRDSQSSIFFSPGLGAFFVDFN
ncbi:hypothetical protein L2E82_52609 [Cichorium intybus]|nr:hypothetical protein L2E82_53461 [Cichorium intybus]KAI3672320.1 hypothetical protein L2E82_52825 [Cichorium intybus]KAI3674110.1 hypothetical protein L2E82_52609 [Cichorium intybus]